VHLNANETNDLTSGAPGAPDPGRTDEEKCPYPPDSFESEVWTLHRVYPKRKAKWIASKLGQAEARVQRVLDAIDQQAAKPQPGVDGAEA
jgi:hypothetical protein